jgi:putative effector of murein hydrolase
MFVAPSRSDYGVLRFVSSMMVLLGWVIIIASLIIAGMYYTEYVASGDAIVRQGQNNIPLNNPVRIISPEVTALFVLLFGVTFGLCEIAAGQIITVILDIRDDVRKFVNAK